MVLASVITSIVCQSSKDLNILELTLPFAQSYKIIGKMSHALDIVAGNYFLIKGL
jgi:hypothetical protein